MKCRAAQRREVSVNTLSPLPAPAQLSHFNQEVVAVHRHQVRCGCATWEEAGFLKPFILPHVQGGQLMAASEGDSGQPSRVSLRHGSFHPGRIFVRNTFTRFWKTASTLLTFPSPADISAIWWKNVSSDRPWGLAQQVTQTPWFLTL